MLYEVEKQGSVYGAYGAVGMAAGEGERAALTAVEQVAEDTGTYRVRPAGTDEPWMVASYADGHAFQLDAV